MRHVYQVEFQGFTLADKYQTVLLFGGTEGTLPVAHLLIDIDAQLSGRQRHLDGVAPAQGTLIVVLHQAVAHHHLLEVGGIKLFGQMLADAVVLREIALEGIAVAQLIGNNTAVTQHATLVHRVLQHLLRQAVETGHRLRGPLETERLGQREVDIEY